MQGILGMAVIVLPFGLIGMFIARRRFRTRLSGFMWGYFGALVGFFFGGTIAVVFDAPVMQVLLMGLIFAPAGLLVIWARRPAEGPPCRECGTPLKLAWTSGRSKPVAANVCSACAAEQAPTAASPHSPKLAGV